MTVIKHGGEVATRLNDDPPENSCRPAVDVLFRSVAEVYSRHTLAVVLTGMGQDGFLGSKRIHEAGGKILVQDERTSVVWGMPGILAGSGMADAVLSLDRIAGAMTERVWIQRNHSSARQFAGSGN